MLTAALIAVTLARPAPVHKVVVRQATTTTVPSDASGSNGTPNPYAVTNEQCIAIWTWEPAWMARLFCPNPFGPAPSTGPGTSGGGH